MSDIYLSPKITYGFTDYRHDIWGDSFSWASERKSTDVKWLAIHHSAGPRETTPDQIAATHKARGWSGVGYHFIITEDGHVWYVGDLGTARANVENQNNFVIGICLTGDFTKYLPTDQQIKSAHELCSFLLFTLSGQFPNLKGWGSVVGHKFFKATACPGSSWDDPISGIRHRIVNDISYSPVTVNAPPKPHTDSQVVPNPSIGPSADYHVLSKRVQELEEKVKNDSLLLSKIVLALENLSKSVNNDLHSA